jgi:hypothetical protein
LTITDLILDFQKTAKLVVDKFIEKYGTTEMFHTGRSKTIIPRKGSLDFIQEYSFHGGGLYAKLKGVEIDFDFGENDRIDGFDAWRLKHFAESKSDLYSMFNTEGLIQAELDKLLLAGKIFKPGTHPGSSNYYWT